MHRSLRAGRPGQLLSRLVIDASVMVRVLVENGPAGDRVRTALAHHDLHAPELLDLETASALRRLVHSGTLPARIAERALAELARAPVLRYPPSRWCRVAGTSGTS